MFPGWSPSPSPSPSPTPSSSPSPPPPPIPSPPPTPSPPPATNSLPPWHSMTCGRNLEAIMMEAVVLILEGRMPTDSKSCGFTDGPHCPGAEAADLHICNLQSPSCKRMQDMKTLASNLWKEHGGFCLEIRMCCECKRGDEQAAKNLFRKSDCVLERWFFKCMKDCDLLRCIGDRKVDKLGLYQALRSQLSFSQLSAWYAKHKGGAPKNITHRITPIPRNIDIDSEMTHHNFPFFSNGRSELRIKLYSHPRSEILPVIHCSTEYDEENDFLNVAVQPKEFWDKFFCDDTCDDTCDDICEVMRDMDLEGGAASADFSAGGSSGEQAAFGGRNDAPEVKYYNLFDPDTEKLFPTSYSNFMNGDANNDVENWWGSTSTKNDTGEAMMSADENLNDSTFNLGAIFNIVKAMDMLPESLAGFLDFESLNAKEENVDELLKVWNGLHQFNVCDKIASKRKTTVFNSKYSKSRLLGNFEETVLHGFIRTVMSIEGYTMEVGVSHSFSPSKQIVHAVLHQFTFGGSDETSTSQLVIGDMGCKMYTLPTTGRVQVTLKNTLGKVINIFIVPYSFTDLPTGIITFLRQRIYNMPQDTEVPESKWMRYVIDLKFSRRKSGRLVLRDKIRAILMKKTAEDAANDFDENVTYMIKSVTVGPNITKPVWHAYF